MGMAQTRSPKEKHDAECTTTAGEMCTGCRELLAQQMSVIPVSGWLKPNRQMRRAVKNKRPERMR